MKLLRVALFMIAIIASYSRDVQITRADAEAFTQSSKHWEMEREKAYNHQQFARSFRDMQLRGQSLLAEHEARRLTSEKLAKESKLINKCAKTVRSLTVLGNLAEHPKIEKDIVTPKQFDDSIRRLVKHIWDFAHNPHLQNNKVFDTEQAKRAQLDLLAIIDLSKVIENNAKNYTFNSSPIN